MKGRWLSAAFVAFSFGFGCAPAVPPVQPQVVSVAESPSEFRWQPVKWKPGMTLLYATEVFQETRSGDQVLSSTSQRQNFTMSVADRTSRGLLPLRLAAEGHVLAEIFVDDVGRARDFSLLATQIGSDDAEAVEQLLVGFVQNPIVMRFNNTALRLNTPEQAEFPIATLAGPFMKPVAAVSPTLRIDISYVGYRVIEGRRGVALQTSILLPGSGHRFRVRGVDDVVTVDSLLGEGTIYLHPEGLFTIHQYQTITMRLRAKGKTVSVRQVTALKLDGGSSKGL